jgi:hypothetical protein
MIAVFLLASDSLTGGAQRPTREARTSRAARCPAYAIASRPHSYAPETACPQEPAAASFAAEDSWGGTSRGGRGGPAWRRCEGRYPLTAREDVLRSHDPHESRRRHDRDLAERIECKQIAVAGDDKIRVPANG